MTVMAKKKKGKNKIKKIQQRIKKNKLKRAQSRPKKTGPILPGIEQLFNRSPISEIPASEGFIPMSIMQAIMEYAKPFMEIAESHDINDQNEIFQIVQSAWNYTIMLETGKDSEEAKMKIVNSIASIYGMDIKDANDFFEKMLQRKIDLFPPEMQQKPSMTMFMKKQETKPLVAFNYNKLDLSGDPIPADTKDKALITAIIKMDQFIVDQADYDDWEDHYLSMEEACFDRFNKWLNDKGLNEYSQNFPYWTETFLNFIYRYMHDDIVLLKDIPPIYIEEFFADYLLRKVMAEPHEYVQFIPAIKTFYTFLHEKGYFDNPEPMIELLNAAEPLFLKILKKRYGK
jgi:hypothetical protein